MTFRWPSLVLVLLMACGGGALAQDPAPAQPAVDAAPAPADGAAVEDPAAPAPMDDTVVGPAAEPATDATVEEPAVYALPEETPAAMEPVPVTAQEAAPPPIPSSAPTPVPVDDSTRSILIIASAGVLAVTLVLIVVLLIKRSRDARGEARQYVAEAYLRDVSGSTTQAMYRLGSKPVMLGRVGGKDTEFLDYIVVPSATIGRRHALIEFKDFGYWIMDQGSINGTFVNNRPVTSEVRLKHGDRIRLHKLEFEFVMPEVGDSSVTVLAGDAPRGASAVVAAAGAGVEAADFELDLEPEPERQPEPAEADLDALRESVESGESTLLPGTAAAKPGAGSDDETLMPAGSGKDAAVDETLLPGVGTSGRPEARPGKGDGEKKGDEFFDITGGDY